VDVVIWPENFLINVTVPSQVILGLVVETPDITLVGIRARLADRGVRVGIGTLWRFFDRHRITRKKRPPTRRNRTAPTS